MPHNLSVIGVLITLLVSVGWMGLTLVLARRLLAGLDPAARLGISGLLGLGLLGLITFFIGMVPGGLSIGIWLVGLAGVSGLVGLRTELTKPKLPSGPWLAPLAIAVIAGLMALISVLAPSDPNDWDSLAYHLAVPKLWIEQGQISYIPFIHQSNFPFAVDNLYLWGLQWGGQSGAKAFELAFFIFGALAIFGIGRSRYGDKGGWWALVIYATVPTVLWEAGSAYIDLANGLFSGLGIVFVALFVTKGGRKNLGLAALFLGLGAASKYTGFQTILVAAIVLVVYGISTKMVARSFKAAVLVGVVGVALASPWLVRNIVNTHNPLYPFFYEQVGSLNWDQRRADVYKNEQQTFGVGRTETGRDKLAIGHAVMGLAYQPGRYVNPAQDQGLGSPLGALGIAVMAAWFLWMISGRMTRFEGSTVAILVLSAVIWFFLSQQSRYILTWAIPLAILGGGGILRLTFGKALAAIVGLQAVISLFLTYNYRTSTQSLAVFGSMTPEAYQTQTTPFYEAAQAINKLGPTTKVALYDEVFGYFLDVPYMWANPGHSTLIPYDSMNSGTDYVREMKALGFTHIYIVPGTKGADAKPWMKSMGFNVDAEPFDDEKRQAILKNWEIKWMILLAAAVKEGKVKPIQQFRNGFLFEIE